MRYKFTQDEIRAALALIEQLAERWPKCFAVFEWRRRPVKVGIHHDLTDVAPETLSLALKLYTGNRGYLWAMTRAGAERIDLAGNPVGTVTEQEAAVAVRTLERRAARKARQVSAPIPAPEPTVAPPKRLTLADLREAGRLRKQKALEQQSASTG